ncbi:copper homeostasis protein [Bacillus fengqiuensis]|nr:copper homeostasis protein [Bacillus fengqiuensis]
MIVEVIATSVMDAIKAEKGGADRLELVSAISEGGLTPSYGLMKEVIKAVQIPVYVMIRPHSSSFIYTEADVKTMVEDIHMAKQLGASGIVTGALDERGEIDEEFLHIVTKQAEGLGITFHRAFDEVTDQLEALAILKTFPQIHRVLTSGGQGEAIGALDRYCTLVKQTEASHLAIMAGAGLNAGILETFLKETQVNEIHFGRGVRESNDYRFPIDEHKIQEIKQICRGI